MLSREVARRSMTKNKTFLSSAIVLIPIGAEPVLPGLLSADELRNAGIDR